MTTTQDTITVTIDGEGVEARPGELLIEVAKRAGIYIPYFCYHPRMDPVGACRMCLVNVQPGPPKPQTSCTTRVSDGMIVETQFVNKGVQEAQQGVLEFLLINHPLDCPICDRAGECPLQDQTQDYGPSETRFIEPKRRFEKAVPISPLITLDRERCILCYRCTRFCDELSGDTLLGVMERGADAFIFPFEGEAFDSYFSGNTVQICPVGALTSTTYRFSARPWDIHNVDSTCNMCGCGCSLEVGVRVQDGNVVRFSGATNEATNEEWLCDKGRYGNSYVSSPERITHPYARKDGKLEAVGWEEALGILTEKVGPVLEGDAPSGVIVGESLCDEDLYAAQKFARLVLKTNSIDHRLEGGLEAGSLIDPSVTYDDVLQSDLAVLVGLDAREELPILFLRLRIAATKRGLPIALVHTREVALSEHAAFCLQPVPGGEAAAGAALAAALDGSRVDDAAGAAGLNAAEVRALADALAAAERPVILLGPGHCAPAAQAAWRTVAEAGGAKLTWTPRRANTYGALKSGAHPDLLPGWRRADDGGAREELGEAWGATLPDSQGLGVKEILEKAATGELGLLWLVGADVLADVPSSDLGRRALEGAGVVVVQDVQATPAVNHADLVFPAAAFVERDGTLTNWEGRRQGVAAVCDPPGAARADYAILAESARRLGRPIGCRSIGDIQAELNRLLDGSQGVGGLGGAQAEGGGAPIRESSQPEPASGALHLLTYRLLYDNGSRISRTTGVDEITEPAFAELSQVDAQRLGVSDGDEVSVSSAHGSVRLKAQVSKGIRQGAVFIPWNQGDASAQALCDFGDMNPSVVVEKA